MRRKYDVRNKRNFVIIFVISIMIICVFSLFITRYLKSSKVGYLIDAESLVMDIEDKSVEVENDAYLKLRWTDNYYLNYEKKNISFAKNVVVYNSISDEIKLYGKYYEILEDGKINIIKDETFVNDLGESKFYKIDDREYLIVGNVINSLDKSIETNKFLFIKLDKQGNAQLFNDKVNLKSISPINIVTSEFRFDVANEIINFGSYNIDLKKIIGSTNEYADDDENINISESGTGDNSTGTESGSGASGTSTTGTASGNNSGVGTGTINSGLNNGTSGSGIGGNIANNTDSGNTSDIGELVEKTKTTSVIRYSIGLTTIDFDYVIYDPYSEYKSVYVEVLKHGTVEKIYLSRTETHLVIEDLEPDTSYKIDFIYTTVNSDEELVYNTIESFDLKTNKPSYSASIIKISKLYNTLSYKVNLQSGLTINKIDVDILFKYKVTSIDEESGESITTLKDGVINDTINVNASSGYVTSTIDLSDYIVEYDNYVTIVIKDVYYNDKQIDIGNSFNFSFGGI